MSILVGIRHSTIYRFDRRISLAPHLLRLRPAPHCRTPIVSYSLAVKPAQHFINWMQDPFSNYQARLVFPEKTSELVVDVDLVADLTVYNPFDFFVEDYAARFPFRYRDTLAQQLSPFMQAGKWGPLFNACLADIPRDETPIIDFLVAVNQQVYRDVAYTLRMEPGVQTPEETLAKALGSCRDSAWLLVQLLRRLGLAARFVSGYLVQLTADQKSLDGPSGPEADFTDLHAWAEVYVPGAGWLGLDPTSGLFAGEGHIPLCCTPLPLDAAPISGAIEPCEVEFSHSNEVTRLREDPRVTRPFSDQDWGHIDALGELVDERLAAGDVRLTMGGEPTFVSIDDVKSAQWNTDADGPEKRRLAFALSQRLKAHFAPQGLTHYGQGKWYPGEELPRWQYSLYWRRDGLPLWRGPADRADHDASPEQARMLLQRLCDSLGLPDKAIQPCMEDPFYTLWQEGRLPVDEVAEASSKDIAQRTLAHLLDGALEHPAGYCLPLAINPVSKRWQTCLWRFRQGALYLLPGNSPAGLRLPLASLSVQEKNDLFEVFDADPFAPHPAEIQPRTEAEHAALPKMQIHTALVTEVRDGYLYAFMPPLAELDDYVAITDALGQAAADLDLPLRIEGYPPPADPRLIKLAITPDPGVIEVNIHPAANWRELRHTTETLYALARESRLATEKFMLDGRHTGTGGGNHVTLGGASAADSPLLRRPHLLRSLLTFWQHHPSLSYLFSGAFIGPTSQAPRVDEGRIERLYELEIAFAQLPEGDSPSPWLVDRLLRHLLVDLTGNTHRSEFCIDKLYSPDTATGRLGILEFRAFEMPPHARMSLVQMLLLRACVALFWDRPYTHKLVDWGHALHDRFMLPHHLWQDFREVLGFLDQHGYPFQEHWFAPFMEFRCPRIGQRTLGDYHLELRHALEPWYVLGEETAGGSTARYVDSSVERLQVQLRGAPSERFVLTCNGRPIPLAATAEEGCQVAGVRYRAWQPYSALHPGIKPHTPLIFDLFDTWSGRSLGGCTYHAMHPGGRNYEHAPVNALEAEARRINRFQNIGHSHGTRIDPPLVASGGRFYAGAPPRGDAPTPGRVNVHYPHTLDLRFDS
ncbi:MAG: transglutaminase family protein [Spongiibacteraceae bacterium]|jgi:uncharacterized protein (DUF2126 family)|nr:transglutaminase family protein [Spongiibacteraceae bacterium]